MKLNLKYAEGVWVTFRDAAKVKIKMVSMSKIMQHSSIKDKIAAAATKAEESNEAPKIKVSDLNDDYLFMLFNEAIVDWKGFDDDDDKELKCTAKNKKIVYEFYPELREFVDKEHGRLRNSFSTSLKNSKTTVTGTSKKTKKTK